MDPLPVSKIFGVGPRTAKRLEGLGVRTVRDLADLSRGDVAKRFGASGLWIHDLANGIDPRRVTARREEKSHGMERTFAEDILDREELRTILLSFAEEIAFHLRDKGLRGRTVTLKARFGNFQTVTRTKTLDYPTNLGPRIYSVARRLLDRIEHRPLRLLGIQLSKLEDVRQPLQSQLFGEESAGREQWFETNDKLVRATKSLDKLRKKYGRGTVQPASLLGRGRLKGRDGSDGEAGVAGRAPTASDDESVDGPPSLARSARESPERVVETD